MNTWMWDKYGLHELKKYWKVSLTRQAVLLSRDNIFRDKSTQQYPLKYTFQCHVLLPYSGPNRCNSATQRQACKHHTAYIGTSYTFLNRCDTFIRCNSDNRIRYSYFHLCMSPSFVCLNEQLLCHEVKQVCKNETTPEPLNGFSWHLIPRSSTKICRHIPILVKIGLFTWTLSSSFAPISIASSSVFNEAKSIPKENIAEKYKARIFLLYNIILP